MVRRSTSTSKQDDSDLRKSKRQKTLKQDSDTEEEKKANALTKKGDLVPDFDTLFFYYTNYTLVLQARSQQHKRDPQELIKLDEYIHNDLPKSLENGVSLDDFTKVFKWKLMRGKFRPLLGMFSKNATEEQVNDLTRKAALVMKEEDKKLPFNALDPLCELKGVGPATASAYLALFPCEKLPFFSDELAGCWEKELGPIKYTKQYYESLVKQVEAKVIELNKQEQRQDDEAKDFVWTCPKLEKAIWSWKANQQLGNVVKK